MQNQNFSITYTKKGILPVLESVKQISSTALFEVSADCVTLKVVDDYFYAMGNYRLYDNYALNHEINPGERISFKVKIADIIKILRNSSAEDKKHDVEITFLYSNNQLFARIDFAVINANYTIAICELTTAEDNESPYEIDIYGLGLSDEFSLTNKVSTELLKTAEHYETITFDLQERVIVTQLSMGEDNAGFNLTPDYYSHEQNYSIRLNTNRLTALKSLCRQFKDRDIKVLLNDEKPVLFVIDGDNYKFGVMVAPLASEESYDETSHSDSNNDEASDEIDLEQEAQERAKKELKVQVEKDLSDLRVHYSEMKTKVDKTEKTISFLQLEPDECVDISKLLAKRAQQVSEMSLLHTQIESLERQLATLN